MEKALIDEEEPPTPKAQRAELDQLPPSPWVPSRS